MGDDVDRFLARITPETFESWYREREWRRNIKNGTPYFNGPSRVPDPHRHTPSSLLQCHRKIRYRKENAAKEQPDPEGIFWAGSKIEEDVVAPYLEAAVAGDAVVRNSLWIDVTIETEDRELRIKGSTDPCIVDWEGAPLLPTEVKTKKDVDGVTEPNRHHRAQVHAYLHGLTEKYDRQLTDAVIIYLGRTTMDMKVFHEEFDQEFWDEILDWASDQSEYRNSAELPPADPEYGWECTYCSYKNRCGQGDSAYADVGVQGLLPQFDYPRRQLEEYLEAHEDARLTPTLAEEYLDLAEQHGVHPWLCPNCNSDYGWGSMEWSGDSDDPPVCPDCSDDGDLVLLRERPPADQDTETND